MTKTRWAHAPRRPESSTADRRLGPQWQTRWRIEEDGTVDLTRPLRPPKVVKLVAEVRDVRIDLAKSAVIVVDMQNDFFRDDGWFGLLGVDLSPLYCTIDPINRLLPRMRVADVPIVWVNWGVRPDGFGLPPSVFYEGGDSDEGLVVGDMHPTRHYSILARGSWGADVIDELNVEEKDLRVDKMRLSGFWDTGLDGVLRHMGVTTLLFAGVNVDRCVMATLEDAAYLGYDCLLVEDCTATVHPGFGPAHCKLMITQLLGFTTTSDELIAQATRAGSAS